MPDTLNERVEKIVRSTMYCLHNYEPEWECPDCEALSRIIATQILEAVRVGVGELYELHDHSDTPGYKSHLENCCSVCIKNQTITDILAKLGEK